MLMAVAALATSCRSSGSGGGSSASPAQFEAGILTLAANDAGRGGEVQMKVRSGKGQDRFNVIIAQFKYDSARIKLKGCEIAASVGAGTASNKQLLFVEENPGMVRAVVTGSVEALPGDADIFGCTFAVAADAQPGQATIRLEADVSDTDFADHAFRDEVTLAVNG